MRLRVTGRKRETSLDEVAETDGARTGFHLVETRPNPEQEYLLKQGRVLLEKRIQRLGPVYVEILHLRSKQELSTKKAAGFLDVPVGTVKARLHRARVKLSRFTQRPKSGKTT